MALQKLMELNNIDCLKIKTNSERIEELEKENQELKKKNEFLEECLIEIGNIIYS